MIGKKGECYICGRRNTEIHHIYFGKNRNNSDKYGMIVSLCQEHHRGTNGVHGMNGHNLDIALKMKGQMIWEQTKTREEFIQIFGKNYL